MIKLKRILISAFLLTGLFVCTYSQDYNVPLTMEGVDHTSTTSILSKSMGGVATTLKNDVSIMFNNPAVLGTLDKLSISVGSSLTTSSLNQKQQWEPFFSFGSFSTLMDGSTRGIVPVGTPLTSADTNWVPFDNLGPNWDHKRTSKIVPNIFVGAPLKIGKYQIGLGLGYTEYANLDYYYQNNNTLFPEYDLVTIGNPSDPLDSLRRVDWFQSKHKREGSLKSIGGAVSINIFNNLSIGVSANYITGNTDDYDANIGRGVIWFISGAKAQKIWAGISNVSSCLRVDSAVYNHSVTGTSEYSGLEAKVSTQYRSKNLTLGASVTLPVEIVRDFKGTVVRDTAGRNAGTGWAVFRPTNYRKDTSYTEKLYLPVKARFGIGLQVRENVYITAEYEYLPYKSTELNKYGKKQNPWLDGSAFRFGIDWRPIDIMALRVGYRQQKEVFAAQYTAYPDDPVSFNAYSFGVGIELIEGLKLNAAYEYFNRKYEDVWARSYNINTLEAHSFSAQLQYSLSTPFLKNTK